jgi:MFS family permease
VSPTVTSEFRAEPGEAWLRDEGQGAQAVHSGRHRRTPEARSSYREVFAIGEFRALWSAQVLSSAGDQFAQVAIAILVYGRTRSPFLTALAYALTYLPPIAGGPLLSGLADLFPRRRVMVVSDLFRVGTVGLMATPGLPFAALCGLLFCSVLTGVPFSSARAALTPDVLPGDMFVLGSAIGNITYQASQILGFVAGAAVVAVLDPHKTLGVDAVTFAVSAVIVLAGVRSRATLVRDGAARASLWSVSADGIRIVFGSRVLLTLLLSDGWRASTSSPRASPRRTRALCTATP